MSFFAQYPAVSGGGGSNASVGPNGSTAPTSSTEVAGINPSGNLQPLQTDSSGNLLVNISSPVVVSENVAQFGGNNVVTGVGASGLGIPRVTVSNDSSILTAPSPDIAGATGSVTVRDTGSTNTVFFNGQNWLMGTPTPGSAVVIPLLSYEMVSFEISGTWTGILQFELSIDGGVTYLIQGCRQYGANNVCFQVTNNFIGACNAAGRTHFRIRSLSSSAWTGTANVITTLTRNSDILSVTNALRLLDGSSANSATTMTIKASSIAPLSTDTAVVVALSPNSAGIGSVATPATGVMSVQGVTGGHDITVAQGAGAGALAPWSVLPTDPSGNTITVLPSSTSPAPTDSSLVVTISPNSPAGTLPTDAATETNQLAVIGSGGLGGTAATNSELAGGVFSGGPLTLTTGQQAPIQLDTAGNTKISGTVTAVQGTTPWAENVSQFGGNSVVTGTGASGAGIPRVTVASDSTVITAPSRGTLTDNSGTTSATPSTSTTLMASNANRKYLLIQNVGTTAIWINFTSTATTTQPSFQLQPGGSFVQESNFVTTEAITVISAVASQAYTAKQA